VKHGNREAARGSQAEHSEGPGRLESHVARAARPGATRGPQRKKPGTGGEGNYYHVEVRPKKNFVTFRTQDVGDPGHIQRVAGQRQSGSWDTVKWLIGKEDAHVEGGKLIPDTADARQLLADLGSEPVHVRGDVFQAKPRPNVPEKEKPTRAQQQARRANIKKAQAARHRRT
jgi:hypothetical protein